MTALAQVHDPDRLVATLAIFLIGGFCLVRFVRWLLCGPKTPDPWSEQISAEMSADDALALCHRCLTPHDSLRHFCSDCGAPVGTYTNWMPYPYLFSIGHTLRIGTSGSFKRSPLTIAGFFLFTFAEYSLLAPIYWVVFLKKLFQRSPVQLDSDQAPEAAPDPPSDQAS
jgi:hypothetical protein